MTPAHVSRERRWRVAALVVLVVAGVGIAVGVRSAPAPVDAAPLSSTLVGAPDASRRPGTARASPWAARRPASSSSPTRPRNPSRRISPPRRTREPPRTPPPRCRRTASSPGHPRPGLGLMGVRDRHHLGRRRGGHPDGVRILGVVTGSLPEHDRGSVVLRQRSTAAANILYISLLNPTSTPVVVDLSFAHRPAWCTRSTIRGSCSSRARWRWRTSRRRYRRPPLSAPSSLRGPAGSSRSEVQTLVGVGLRAASPWCRGSPPRRPIGRFPRRRRTKESVQKSMCSTPARRPRRSRCGSGCRPGRWLRSRTRCCPARPGRSPGARRRAPAGETYATTIEATGGPGVVVGRTVASLVHWSRPRLAHRWRWTV